MTRKTITRTILTLSMLLAASAPASSARASAPSANAGADHIAAIELWNQQMFTTIGKSVVFIAGQENVGSGFFVSADGWILTNAHVVEGERSVDVVLNDGRRFEGRIMERAKDADFALVKIEATGLSPLRLDTQPLRVGTWLGSVGHGAGGAWTYNTGLASNIYPIGNAREVVQTNIPLNKGNSGGPLFNRQGLVVGVVTAGMQNANNVNYGFRSSLALESLTMLGDHCECWVIHTHDKVPVFLDGESVGAGPRVVVPVREGSHELSVVHQGKRIKRQAQWPANKSVDLRR